MSPQAPNINDVTVTIATSNGTGSQSANLILMNSIFNMGIPVSGKNMFPSNIQGLPTWFTVRVSEEGWTARKRDSDVFVCMNGESVVEDLSSLRSGATVLIDKNLADQVKREDLDVRVVPFSALVVDICKETKLRKMVVNMIYVGVLAHLLEIDVASLKQAVSKQFAKKAKAVELNTMAAMAGLEWAQKNLSTEFPFKLKKSNKTDNKIVIDGNQATAIGLMFGGLTVLPWYPITPSSSVCESAIDLFGQFRHDPETGKATYAIVQAEDELASMAMVVGAGWAGARAATSTSGPGISLMSELAGLSYFAEIPAVIVDVQRMGPSTGLPTRTCQGDIWKAYHLSHGDCKHPLLLPGNVSECYEFAAEALNLAERLQTLIFVMTDLDLGMNSWMSEPFKPLDKPIDRGKVLSAEDLAKVDEFARYRDVDGDGIPYRTLPGTPHPKAAYFTRGTGHTDRATYSEKSSDWKANMDRLTRKFDTARELCPQPVVEATDGTEIGIIAFGTSDDAVQEARAGLRRAHGIETDYLRLRALPISNVTKEFIAKHRVVFVIEQNRDAQCASILRLECPEDVHRLKSLLNYDGLPLDAMIVVEHITAHEQKKAQGTS